MQGLQVEAPAKCTQLGTKESQSALCVVLGRANEVAQWEVKSKAKGQRGNAV